MRDLPQIIDYDKDQLAYALANALKERDEAREIIKIVAQDKDKIIEQLIVERDSAREIYKTLHSLYADEIVKNINI